MMKHSSRQFGDSFSGFGRQSEKFSRIGACIRRNFTPSVVEEISRNTIALWHFLMEQVKGNNKSVLCQMSHPIG